MTLSSLTGGRSLIDSLYSLLIIVATEVIHITAKKRKILKVTLWQTMSTVEVYPGLTLELIISVCTVIIIVNFPGHHPHAGKERTCHEGQSRSAGLVTSGCDDMVSELTGVHNTAVAHTVTQRSAQYPEAYSQRSHVHPGIKTYPAVAKLFDKSGLAARPSMCCC